jgi:aspartate-semialdehyde dehydrogenase
VKKTGLALLGVAGKTPFAFVGQRGLALYANHPWFEVTALIADDPADVGLTLGEAVAGRWQLDEPVPAEFARMRLVGIDGPALRDAGVELVLSGLPGPQARELDPQLAALGFGVVSESMGLRMEDDVPLIVPEINPDHLSLIERQRETRGYDGGFLVASPLCTAVIVALALEPLRRTFGLTGADVTTLQALSGAGRSGVAALQVIDNVLPHIGGEEEKLDAELRKIFGAVTATGIENWSAPFASTCFRVPVRDGHTASISAGLAEGADLTDVARTIVGFTGAAAELGLPSAPPTPLILRGEVDRPQPFLDRDAEHGRAVSVGRLRVNSALAGVSLVAVGHNHNRGTVGNALLVTELIRAAGVLR